MTVLVTEDVLRSRSATATTELAPLADGLLAELEPVMSRELFIPREKALLSREGGRCPRDGATLAFDPFSPHRHRCPVCERTYTGSFHDRFWIFWYQLWLAERAVHGALLANLRCDERAGAFAAGVLDRYADQYLLYPNRDNVLGPTRPFFSTYLESIWLLNLCIATDLLEQWQARYAPLGARVRDRILEPSSTLIASYDEGASNRQVWNDAALLAASHLLGRAELGERALFGRSGVTHHLANGLLTDGTWYEGENYHLFAHRGLWYGVTIAEANDTELPGELLERFQEGFASPFLSSLPDMTLPSRRDSQYAISLRQSRFAELCELGLARQADDGDARLRGILRRLYLDDVPRRDTGRAQSTADVERNLPGTHLTRADLGWRSLLFARPTLPPLEATALGSVLLDAQGLAVFRRADERVYVALDYGASGGGHGHPDRLNLLLSDGETRWLDDMGTGSYVDPSLHWYRSTLAHNAPLFNGYQQLPVDGELVAFDEQGELGWVCARAFDLFPGIVALRTLVVTSEYLFDELVWHDPEPGVMDLPIHVDPAAVAVRRAPPNAAVHSFEGIAQLEDTLGLLREQRGYPLVARTVSRITTRDGERSLHGFLIASEPGLLYRAVAPGAPGKGPKPFLLLRVLAGVKTAWVRTVWSWSPDVENIWLEPSGAFTAIERRDGSHDRLQHIPEGYSIERVAGATTQTIHLTGLTSGKPGVPERRSRLRRPKLAKLRVHSPVTCDLGAADYRRSEETWEEAGRPTAHLRLVCLPNEIGLDITVHKVGRLTFVPVNAINPYDNEHPDVNGDGLQLYLVDRRGASAWMLVPEVEGEEGKVRVRVINGSTLPVVDASWHRIERGYAVSVRLPLAASPQHEIGLGVVVNEKPEGRERRRGQLVLGGARGEFVYLRGDREDLDRLPRFRIVR